MLATAITGLLEDLSLTSQLLVTRIFDVLRWLLDCLPLLGGAGSAVGAGFRESEDPPALV